MNKLLALGILALVLGTAFVIVSTPSVSATPYPTSILPGHCMDDELYGWDANYVGGPRIGQEPAPSCPGID